MSDVRPSKLHDPAKALEWWRAEGSKLAITELYEAVTDPVAAVRRGVESGEIEGWVLLGRDRIRYCPFCGRLPERENPDDEMCLPTNCEAWKFVSRFNHETREWEPVDE